MDPTVHATPIHQKNDTVMNKKSPFAVSVDRYTLLLIVSILFFVSSLSFWLYVQFFL
jgi:hypothetical protein